VPWSPLPSEDGPPPVRVGETVDRVLRGLGAPTTVTFTQVFDRWEQVVGPAIASRTRPLSLDAGRLVIAVDDGGWASQIRWMERELLTTMADRLGDGVVTSVEVRVRPL
jgi:predicted nucleic acid-binding Zn ribbon protein